MSLDVDATSVIKAVINTPHVFKDVSGELNKFAHSVVLKQLKAKGANVTRLRDVHRVIGKDAFILIVESVPDDGKSLKSLLAKFDKHWPEIESANAPSLRNHIVDLARGAIDPAKKLKSASGETGKMKSAASERKRKTPAKRAISGKAFTATWDRKDRTD